MTSHESGDADAVRHGRVGRRLAGIFDLDLRRRAINVGHLLSGNGVTGALAIVGAGLTARALGPADYGLMALVISYGRVFDRLMRFESWQPLIKYAAHPIADEERTGYLRTLFAFGLWLDLGACLAAAASSIVLALIAAPWFGLDAGHVWLVVINAVALLFNVNGMPTAVLRLAGRFSTIAYVQVSGGVLRILLCLIGAWNGGGLLFFITAWTVSQVFGSLLFMAIAWSQLHKQGLAGLLSVPLRGITRRFPGIMSFAWSSSLSISIRASAMEFDVLVVGALCSPAAAGLYAIAKQVAKAVQQLCGQVQAVLYPDLTRLWSQGAITSAMRAVMQVQWVLDAFSVLVIGSIAVGGRWMIDVVAGAQFAEAYPLLMVQMVALALTMHAAPLRSVLLAMGAQRAVLHIVLWTTAVFQVLLVVLTRASGPIGANYAHVGLAVLNVAAMEWITRRRFRVSLAAAAMDVRSAS